MSFRANNQIDVQVMAPGNIDQSGRLAVRVRSDRGSYVRRNARRTSVAHSELGEAGLSAAALLDRASAVAATRRCQDTPGRLDNTQSNRMESILWNTESSQRGFDPWLRVAFTRLILLRDEQNRVSTCFRYHFQLGGEERNLNVLLYYDGAHQWPTVYPSNKTCWEKESILNIDYGQIIPLNTSMRLSSGCVKGDDDIVRCDSQRRFISARPRWWFIVLADCSSTKGLNVTYWISLTNAPSGKFWKEHFSADEFYILPLLIPTVCMYMIFIALGFYISLQLRSRRLLHISYKLFMASLLCQLIGVSCELYSYVNLGLRGVPAMNAYLLSQLSEACSETLYTILMLLLALGYTVTKSVLTSSQIRWLILFVGSTAICQMFLYVYQSEEFDPGLVLYIYESPPGYGLIALKLIAWFVFVTRCFKTIRKLNTKLNFYTSLLFLGSVWFLFHPLIVLINTIFVDEWVRESMAKGSSLFIVFLGHIMFLYVTRPSVNNKRFPFHIRTFQVVPIGGHGQDHSYEPGPRTAATAFTITRTPAYFSQSR